MPKCAKRDGQIVELAGFGFVPHLKCHVVEGDRKTRIDIRRQVTSVIAQRSRGKAVLINK